MPSVSCLLNAGNSGRLDNIHPVWRFTFRAMSATSAVVTTTHLATATRRVSGLPVTSTIRAWPCSSMWVNAWVSSSLPPGLAPAAFILQRPAGSPQPRRRHVLESLALPRRRSARYWKSPRSGKRPLRIAPRRRQSPLTRCAQAVSRRPRQRPREPVQKVEGAPSSAPDHGHGSSWTQESRFIDPVSRVLGPYRFSKLERQIGVRSSIA